MVLIYNESDSRYTTIKHSTQIAQGMFFLKTNMKPKIYRIYKAEIMLCVCAYIPLRPGI